MSSDDTVLGQNVKKTAQDEFRARFKKASRPDDFDTDDNFLKFATKLFDSDLQFDRENRNAAVEDAEFMVGDQWDNFIKKRRVRAQKPTLTFNRLPAFVGQIVGDRRLNETDVKIVADDNKHKNAARIREGLVRSIQKNSRANTAYTKALENQVIGGMGCFEICLEYAHDDVFEQDVKIKEISNSFSVVWDQMSVEPSGADAMHCFKVQTMKKSVFKQQYPDANAGDPSTDLRILGYDIDRTWITEDEVRIINFWRMRTRKRIVALLRDEDGTEDVEDVTDRPPEEWMQRVVIAPSGSPIMREVDRKYVELYTITALDILEGPYELPIKRVPVFAVPGWKVNVGTDVHRFGLIRFLKDPQRLHNYWRSIIAEKLMLTPKGNWIATEEAVEGRQKEWRESHLSDDPLLTYDGDHPAPVRIPPSQIEAGLIEQAGMAAQDLRDISNLHQASLGQQSNEVSGVAIQARQRVGETGTVIYQDNLNLAIEECGKVINQLIPHVYDTARTIKILGVDGKDIPAVVINDETDEDSVDITAGKYSVSSTTGPSFATKRIEASESMLNMVNAVPQTMAIVLDKIIEAQDWPGATEIARRLREQLPPGTLNEDDMTDEQKERLAQQAAAAQEEQAKADAVLEVEMRLKASQADQASALAAQAEANAMKSISEVGVAKFKAVSDVENTRIGNMLDAMETFDKVTQQTGVTGD